MKPTLIRSTVIYCSGRPLLVCHDNYMISDCWCRGGERCWRWCSRARTRNTWSVTCKTCRESMLLRRSMESFMCKSFLCFPLQPPCCAAPPGLVVAAAVPQLTPIFQPHPPQGSTSSSTRPAHEWTRSSPQCVFLGSGHAANLVFALAVESLI